MKVLPPIKDLTFKMYWKSRHIIQEPHKSSNVFVLTYNQGQNILESLAQKKPLNSAMTKSVVFSPILMVGKKPLICMMCLVKGLTPVHA